jgi:hypothetical protein
VCDDEETLYAFTPPTIARTHARTHAHTHTHASRRDTPHVFRLMSINTVLTSVHVDISCGFDCLLAPLVPTAKPLWTAAAVPAVHLAGVQARVVGSNSGTY